MSLVQADFESKKYKTDLKTVSEPANQTCVTQVTDHPLRNLAYQVLPKKKLSSKKGKSLWANFSFPRKEST